MAQYSTSELKNGTKVILDNDPCTIISNEFIKPGKGQAFNRIKLRNLKTGKVLEKTFKSGDSLEAADVVDLNVQYLYYDGSLWHFMNPTTFEQYSLSKTVIADAALWLKEQDTCQLTLWNNEPIAITTQNFVVLKITATDPGIRGDTATGGSKPATLETGAVVRVPLFIQEGELIKIDTRTGEYVSRARE